MEDALPSADIEEVMEDESYIQELRELRERVLSDLKTRDEWLRRQAVWYQMRHDGLRRQRKPWPGAADLHFPLADSIIERLKPFYFNQLFGTETMAQFVANDPALEAMAADLGYWFDFQVKQRSNIETEMLACIDMMLMAGSNVMQVRWDAGAAKVEEEREPEEAEPEEAEPEVYGAEKVLAEGMDGAAVGGAAAVARAGDEAEAGIPQSRDQRGTLAGKLVFDAVEPSRVIVPEWTRELQEADRVTLVKTISVEQYKRDGRWPDKSADFIERIAGNGKGGGMDGTNTELEELQVRREGLTQSANPEEIVYWEVWEHVAEGWVVHWISPLEADLVLRPAMRNPFLHGKLPMVRFDVEVKGGGHYSSRGICERIGAFESAVNKLWNEKMDYLTLCNRPLFTTAQAIPNAANLKLTPGQIIPGGLSAVQMPAPPISFEEEMQQQRAAAEGLIGMPDFGLGANNNVSDARTATEVNKIASLTNISVDLKARMFRRSLGELYGLAFATLLQYEAGGRFLAGNEVRSLPPQVLAGLMENPDGMSVQPNGSGDSWNKQGQLQKAIARKQLLGQSPWIDQEALDRSILELDDPRLVKRLMVDSGVKQKREYVAEAEEVPALMLGFPLPVEAGEDHAVRIRCLAQFMQQRAAAGAHPDPVAMRGVVAHLQAHLAALSEQDPKGARALVAELGQGAQAQQQQGRGMQQEQMQQEGAR